MRASQRLEVGRHPHDQTARQVDELAAHHEPRTLSGRVHQVRTESHLADESDGLGTGCEDRLGTLVERKPLEFAHPQDAADVRARLEHGHMQVVAFAAHLPRRGEARDAPAHDDHVRPAVPLLRHSAHCATAARDPASQVGAAGS
jgi:hypothetical protein